MERLPPKETQCDCGHIFNIDRRRYWCEKCANPVYYYENEKNTHKWNTFLMYLAALGVVTFLGYIFIEMIVIPWNALK
jgi:hypothetical protein